MSCLAAIGACSDAPQPGSPGADGGPNDGANGSPDARPDGAPAVIRVGVTVLSDAGDGKPDTSATVIFADRNRALVKQGLVGAEGKAEADLPLGGVVHVLRVTQTAPDHRTVTLVSLLDVEPGDELIVGTAAGTRVGPSLLLQGNYTPVADATEHAFDHPCGGGFGNAATVVSLLSYVGCLPAMFDVLGTATSSSNAAFVPKYTWFTTTPTSDFIAPAMQDMPAFTVRLTNAPAASFTVLERATLLPPYFNDLAAPIFHRGVVPAGTSTVELYYPPSATSIGVVVSRSGSGTTGPQQGLYTRIPGAAASVDLDLGALPLPLIETAPVLSGKVVSWTQKGTGAPDARQVSIASTHIAGGTTYAVSWTVIDGAMASSAELPGLPDMFAEIDPTQQLTPQPGTASVEYVDYSNLDGYDAARRHPTGSLMAWNTFGCLGCGLFGGELYSKRVSTSFAQ